MLVPINSEPTTTVKDKPLAGGRLAIPASTSRPVIHYFAIGILAPAAVLGWAQAASAGDWKISTGVGVNETYSDNAKLAPDNGDRESDLITSITPNISINGRGGRSSLNLNYSHSRLIHANDTRDDTSINSLAATGKLEVWDRVAFINANASISRQVIDSGGAVSDSAAGQTENRTEVRSFSISPTFLHHFGNWVETVSRINFSSVTNDSGTVSNSSSQNESFRASSGSKFQKFGWSLSLNTSKQIREDGIPSRKSRSVSGNFTFPINRKFSLLSGVGYADADDGTLFKDEEGITWNAGFTYTPSPRTSIRATYGSRFQSRDITMSASHSLSSRTSFTASYSEGQTTSQSRINQDLADFSEDPDEETPTIGNENFDLQSTTFRRQSFSAGVSGSRRRNTFNLNMNWQSRETDSTGIEQIVTGISGGFGRQLSKRANANFSASFNHTDFGDLAGRIDNSLTVRGNLTYKIMETASAVLSYTRTQRRSDGDSSGLTENAVVVGLSKRF